MNPVRLAGYQGPASILTAALRSLEQSLAPRLAHMRGQAALHTEINVTAQGETAASLFASVEHGTRQICYVASGYLAAKVPELAALDLPFTVHDRHLALRALDGAAGALFTSAVEARTGYKVLGYWDNGFRHISNAVRPLRSPADCAGLTIRTLDSAIYREALTALGFVPRSIDVKELVRVVQSREVDAQENPLTNFVNFGLHNHHPHVSLTGHFFGVLLLVCNRAWFAALAPAVQEALLDAARQATALQRAQAAREDESLTCQLHAKGLQIIEASALDLAAMKQATGHIVELEARQLAAPIVSAYLDAVRR